MEFHCRFSGEPPEALLDNKVRRTPEWKSAPRVDEAQFFRAETTALLMRFTVIAVERKRYAEAFAILP